MHSLEATTALYHEREYAASVVRLDELSRPASRAEWVRLFSNLSQRWQEHAVRTCQHLHQKVAGYLSEYGQLPIAKATVRHLSFLSLALVDS